MNNFLDYIEFKERLKTETIKKTHGGISKIMFRTGRLLKSQLPKCVIDVYEHNLRLNPNYLLVYFSDIDCEFFIRENHGEEIFDLYDTLVPSAFRADFWRYLILDTYGGCYGDFTHKCFVSYDKIIENFEMVFCRDTSSNKILMYNAFMCTQPNNVVIKRAIEICIKNIKNKYYGVSSLAITGPVVLGDAYQEFSFDGRNIGEPIKMGNVDGKIKIVDNNPNYSTNCIIDETYERLIDKKIGENHDILYDKDNLYYNDLWNLRQVYRNNLILEL